MVKRNCLQCGNEFRTFPYYIKKGQGKFCGQKCWGISIRRYKADMIKKVCLICQTEFHIHPYQIKRGRKYCSQKCTGISYRKTIIKNCLRCDKELETIPSKIKNGAGKFCTNNCKAKHYGLLKTTNIIKNCEICNKELKVHQYKIKRGWGKCCSKKCFYKRYSIVYIEEKSPSWRGGISFEPYTPDFNKRLKELIRERDNRICQMCNTRESKLKTKLCCHHIDYVKANSFPQNLVSLCNPCHLATNQNREIWKSFFHNLLTKKYSYEYTSDQKILLDFS